MLGWGALLLVIREISVLKGTLRLCIRSSLGDASVARALEQLGLGLGASALAPSSLEELQWPGAVTTSKAWAEG